jgi:hypothetical protein
MGPYAEHQQQPAGTIQKEALHREEFKMYMAGHNSLHMTILLTFSRANDAHCIIYQHTPLHITQLLANKLTPPLPPRMTPLRFRGTSTRYSTVTMPTSPSVFTLSLFASTPRAANGSDIAIAPL